MSDLQAKLTELASMLTSEQLNRVAEHMELISQAVVPILSYFDINQASQESYTFQIDLIEEGIRNPPPYDASIVWSPLIDQWLARHHAKLLIAPGQTKRINENGEVVIEGTGVLSLFDASVPGEQGKPQVPTTIRNSWAYAQGQFEALLHQREGRSQAETDVQDHLTRTIAEYDQKRAQGYEHSELENWKAYSAGDREPYLAEMRADFLSSYLSAWPSQKTPKGGSSHD
jgi:hypothetical protein